MKKLIYIAAITTSILVMSCGGPKREPGSVYMPDMAYSRAYESYPNLDATVFTDDAAKAGFTKDDEKSKGLIYYDRKPVAGTMKRGQVGVFRFTNDSASKANAKSLINPLATDSSVDMKEAERLYNIYCAICHGTDLKGQGPLVASGKWAGAAAILMDAKFGRVAYGDGQIFHTMTYGKNTMGSYASQLNNKQRWMIVKYIRSKQDKANAPAATSSTPAASTPASSTPATSTPAASTPAASMAPAKTSNTPPTR